MKKILALALMAISSMAFAKDVTKFPLGEVAIKDTTVEVTTAKGKTPVTVDDSNMSVTVKNQFTNAAKDKSLVLLQLSSGGNGCPATYMVVEVNASGAVKQTEEFGTCSDIPTINYANNVLTMRMPQMNDIRKVTFKYENGVLTENGKVVK
jgi:hypothetical protein